MRGRTGSVVDNLSGAWRLMLGRPDGLSRLDVTIEGFWRSFAAIVLVLPFAVLAFFSQRAIEAALAPEGIAPLTGARIAVSTLALLVDWIAFPLAFALLARPFGLGSRYVPFIVARNWAAVLIGALVSVLHVLHLLGVLPSAVMPFALIGALAVTFRFSYVIARITLATSMAMAIPVVALDFLLSLVVWSAFDRLAQAAG